MPAPWTAVAGGVTVEVRLTPKGGRDALDGIDRLADGRAVLKARVRAAPQDGEANEALIALVAKALGLARRNVELIGGATSRIKRLRIAGEPAELAATLARLAGAG